MRAPDGRLCAAPLGDTTVSVGAHLTLPSQPRRVPSLSALKGGEGIQLVGDPFEDARPDCRLRHYSRNGLDDSPGSRAQWCERHLLPVSARAARRRARSRASVRDRRNRQYSARSVAAGGSGGVDQFHVKPARAEFPLRLHSVAAIGPCAFAPAGEEEIRSSKPL